NPYKMERTYPGLKFERALELCPVPGKVSGEKTKAWVVAELGGQIHSFDADRKKAVATKKLVLDVGHTVFGAGLHPKFAEKGYLSLSEVPDTEEETEEGSQVVRYTVDPATMRADPETAKVIFTWPNGGHNGGCLRFGPKDGMLYISTGDGGAIGDNRQTGQSLRTLLGKILRIDVDNAAPGETYSIPKDNPFVNTGGARGEIWAYGIRQCWKISFDRDTGDLWAGEVGQDLWESVYL